MKDAGLALHRAARAAAGLVRRGRAAAVHGRELAAGRLKFLLGDGRESCAELLLVNKVGQAAQVRGQGTAVVEVVAAFALFTDQDATHQPRLGDVATLGPAEEEAQ